MLLTMTIMILTAAPVVVVTAATARVAVITMMRRRSAEEEDGGRPEYCGVTEVAKGLWMRHEDMKTTKLVEYALRMGTGAVIRRLGYLLELYAIAPENELSRLRDLLSETYAPLDTLLPREGPHLRRWRLQWNITPQELESIRTT